MNNTEEKKRKPIIIRQTLTSKMRSERYQLEYLQKQLLNKSELKQTQNLDTVSFKKPNFAPKLKVDESSKKLNISCKPSTSKIKDKIPENVHNRLDLLAYRKPIVHVNKTVSNVKQNSNLLNVTINKTNGFNKTITDNKPSEIKTREKFNKSTVVKSNFNTNSSKHKLDFQPSESKTNAKPNNVTKSIPPSKSVVNPKNFIKENINSTKQTVITKKPVQNEEKLKLKPKPGIIRKSLSAMHFKRVSNFQRNDAIQRSQSCADVSDDKIDPDLKSPIAIAIGSKTEIVFKTPSVAQRRSIAFFTPVSTAKTWTESPQDLKQRLSLWLKRKGKPIGAFHHLRCFGLRNLNNVEANKENVENGGFKQRTSYEDLCIASESGVETNKNDYFCIAKDALYDLHKLIQEGYPRDECEQWLNEIRMKYNELEEYPQYWECKAALEEARGNIANAISCYQTAIAKGVNVDESLDNLLQKFKILNIDHPKETKLKSKSKKSVWNVENVFNSSLINFAVRERNIKTNDGNQVKFVATPVRRSARVSRTHYVSTPSVKIYSSLNEVDPSVRDSIQFQTNKALH